jgi:hypothetical protein
MSSRYLELSIPGVGALSRDRPKGTRRRPSNQARLSGWKSEADDGYAESDRRFPNRPTVDELKNMPQQLRASE